MLQPAAPRDDMGGAAVLRERLQARYDAAARLEQFNLLNPLSPDISKAGSGRSIMLQQQLRRIGFVLVAIFAAVAGQNPAAAQDRFEVKSIKAVRPTLVDTINALQQRDVAGARAAFQAYDSAWNGIEVYINVRSRDAYGVLEHGFQARIDKGLVASTPDTAALLTEAQGMLAKFDETVAMVEKAAPLNPLYDDVARLRIVRAPLREVLPALKAGNVEKARKSFAAFDDNWDSIEDMVKAKSAESYVAIEKAMIEIEQALMPDPPDAAKVNALVNDIMSRYNAALAEVVKDARGR